MIVERSVLPSTPIRTGKPRVLRPPKSFSFAAKTSTPSELPTKTRWRCVSMAMAVQSAGRSPVAAGANAGKQSRSRCGYTPGSRWAFGGFGHEKKQRRGQNRKRASYSRAAVWKLFQTSLGRRRHAERSHAPLHAPTPTRHAYPCHWGRVKDDRRHSGGRRPGDGLLVCG